MRKIVLATVVTLILSGCQTSASPAASSDVAATTLGARPTASVSSTPATIPTAEPTIVAQQPLEVARWSRLGAGNSARIDVELHNPNSAWGIVRGTFELTLLDKSGGVVAVTGAGGVPGASCCTLYQIPPNGTYWVPHAADGADASATASVRVRVTSGWIEWTQVPAVPHVAASATRFRITSFYGTQKGARVTGLITVAGTGTFNVQVFALVQGSGHFAVLAGISDCVKAGSPVAFQIEDYLVPPAKPSLAKVIALTTTIPGVGTTDQPPGC
jgi:hypothetical protein